MNVALNYDPTNALPWSYQLYEPDHEKLVDACIQLATVTLDYQVVEHLPDAPTIQAIEQAPGVAVEEKEPETYESTNQFCSVIFSDIPDEMEFIFEGLCRLLNEVVHANNTYLPGSANTVVCGSEIMVLMWKMLEENPAFLPYICKECDLLELVEPVLFHMHLSSQDNSKVGLMYNCSFILVLLSAHRDFAVLLNSSYDDALPLPFDKIKGTYTDLLIILCHRLIVKNPYHMETLMNVLLAVINNLSPYVTKLSLPASIKLVSLLEIFASPKVLYTDPGNSQYIHILLSTFTNMISYQYAGHPNLVYSMLQRKDLFKRLAHLGELYETELSKVKAGKNGYKGNKAWVETWVHVLPTNVIAKLIHFFETHETEEDAMKSETNWISYIAETTMVGVLPLAAPIASLCYVPNKVTRVWFTSYLWGVIYVRKDSNLFNGKYVRMFSIQDNTEE